jgi:DNA modification methylase
MSTQLITGDALTELRKLPAESVHSVVTDPPYHLTTGKRGGSGAASLNENSPAGRARVGTGFMGMTWDGGDVAHSSELWAEVLRVAKPGAHLLAFGGTRTFHRLACAIEDAGWEIRDCIMWVYGSGFPKSLDVSKAIDKAAGVEREVVGRKSDPRWLANGSAKPFATDKGWNQHGMTCNSESAAGFVTAPATGASKQWDGWGTALKPAWEPIIVARKPLRGTVARNVQEHGTGGVNIDGCRVPFESESDRQSAIPQGKCTSKGMSVIGAEPDAGRNIKRREFEPSANRRYTDNGGTNFAALPGPRGGDEKGRWPANVIHDGSDEVLKQFPNVESGEPTGIKAGGKLNCYSEFAGGIPVTGYGDSVSAARFFYCAKASQSDRDPWNTHPTVKPLALMRWLVRLVTPAEATVLDLFLGSGTTAKAAELEHCNCIGIELNPEYVKLAKRRIAQRTIFSGGDA